jgi:hypothetical protein
MSASVSPKFTSNNSPDSFLNGFIRLSGLRVPESSYFSKVSSTPDFDNKILSTVKSGFEAQNSLKFCPEYCSKRLQAKTSDSKPPQLRETQRVKRTKTQQGLVYLYQPF